MRFGIKYLVVAQMLCFIACAQPALSMTLGPCWDLKATINRVVTPKSGEATRGTDIPGSGERPGFLRINPYNRAQFIRIDSIGVVTLSDITLGKIVWTHDLRDPRSIGKAKSSGVFLPDIYSASFTRAGERIVLSASGGGVSTVSLIDSATGRLVRQLETPSGQTFVSSTSVSADGRKVIGVDYLNNRLLYWDVDSGKLIQHTAATISRVHSTYVSESGDKVFVVGMNSIGIQPTRDGGEAKTLSLKALGFTNRYRIVASDISKDYRFVAISVQIPDRRAKRTGHVLVLDMESLKVLHAAQSPAVYSIRFSEDMRHLATAHESGRWWELWDLSKGSIIEARTRPGVGRFLGDFRHIGDLGPTDIGQEGTVTLPRHEHTGAFSPDLRHFFDSRREFRDDSTLNADHIINDWQLDWAEGP